MKGFLQYILGEVKNNRVSKAEAITLIRQFRNSGYNLSDISAQQFKSGITERDFFSVRDMGRKESSTVIGTLLLEPDWKEEDIDQEANVPEYEKHLVILCEVESFEESIKKQLPEACCFILKSEQKHIEERFQSYAVQVFEKIQHIFKDKPKGKVFIQIVVIGQGEQLVFRGLSGLLKTAQLENPKIMGQVIQVEAGETNQGIIEKLKESSLNPFDKEIRYQAGKRWVAGWREIQISQKVEKIPWKDQGVYLITGGAGGLGLIFAKEIAQKVKNATLILTGRSVLTDDKMSQVQDLEVKGVRIEYKQLDVTDKEAVNGLICSMQDEFKNINGIIHCAGEIRDNFIIRKSKEELQAVLAPKVSGLVNLDEASKEIGLDFFILCSSIAGSLGNLGQADYSVANAFMDAYCGYRNELAALKQRHGRMLSINWPLWKDGGMHVDEETEKMMMQTTGMIAMQTSTGIKALYQGLASGKDQLMVMEGDLIKIKKYLLEPSAKTHFDLNTSLPVDTELLREKTLYHLKLLVGEIIKLGSDKIDSSEPLENYGIDSIIITQLNQKLACIFGELSKTLFFEYQTLGDLAEYFITDYPQECSKWTGLAEQVQAPIIMPIMESAAGMNFGGEVPSKVTAVTQSNKTREPIAIIGMSGRYPQSKNLREYWKNLKTGQNCITEIPSERWSTEGFYHPDKQEAVAQGKSYSKWGGFVEGFADFDPLFFNISPREAINMDPQERLFVEACWEVIEDAGYTREQLALQHNRRVGVFAGITKTGFNLYGPDLWKQGEKILPRTSFGSVANRISYLLNLQGPSMPIDTMCSSSLTAIHEACEHIHQGECEMAIAGGVNLYLHPACYVELCNMQMLSTDGQCKSFGHGGNGFVPGEGVGCILLKPLSRAIADGDHIDAVIRGTSINHGGKTNGYTVPSPTAQGELIRDALDKAGINARTVSYIEAHGTGTELGDPIEITGLTQAFQKDTKEAAFCAIGSVKSNIGHLEAAAGIAGITKIVLQMKNKQIVPSLHAKELNGNINFGKTPFVVQQELGEWKRPVVAINGESREYPLIAGISSFGAGGSNAHVVMEEYIAPQEERTLPTINHQNPAIVVLSAKTQESLKDQAGQLLTAIQEQQFLDTGLGDIAYTLQIGREAMEERLAIIVSSIKELEEKLQGFIEGKKSIPDLYQGQVRQNKETLSIFSADEDMRIMINAWISKRKYAKLLDFWVKGMVFDWNKLYGDSKPRRISLPTYSFAKERYWIPKIESKAASNSMTTAFIHPLLHQNTSDFSEQRFSSTFTGHEFFLENHVVKGQCILPGVAYLEMARVAVEQAAGFLLKERTGMRLKNIVWTRPIAVGGDPVQVYIGLFLEENGEVTYEIYSQPESGVEEVVVHSQGSAVFISSFGEMRTLDFRSLRDECSQSILSSDQCYETFEKLGIVYGPGHQGIEKLYIGLDKVVAKLTLPPAVMNTQEQFVLHPSVMDAALQASIGLMIGSGDIKLVLPFALQELEVIQKCTTSMWALIRHSDGFKEGDKVQKLNIDVCDEQGIICVRMKGFSARILEDEINNIDYDNTHNNTSRLKNEIELNNDFYQNLIKNVLKDELSKEQFKQLIKL